MKNVIIALLVFLPCSSLAFTQTTCPVMPTLAAARVPYTMDNVSGENTVIWFFNYSNKEVKGVQFTVFVFDGAGNRMVPATAQLIANGRIKPQHGDMISLDTAKEKQLFGNDWEWMQGIEVRVTRIMFSDASVWTPKSQKQCSASFLDDQYDKAIADWEQHLKKEVRKGQ